MLKCWINFKYPFLFVIIFLFLNACTHGHCPNPLTKGKKVESKIWVYKYDKSKQCSSTAGVSIESMLNEFKIMDVKVYESQKKYDGLLRIQACGAFTGLANMFLIQKTDLDKVASRGFQQWDF